MPLIITFTGTDLSKDELMKMCFEIPGIRVDGPLTNETQILIAGKGGNSEKYKAARRLCLPIVKPDWIYFLHKNTPNINPESEESRAFMMENLVHECCGWSLSTTGFQAADQAAIVKRIKELGGTYNASLTKTITCLVALDPESKSAKMTAAEKWNILVRDKAWLFDEERECKTTPMNAFSSQDQSIFAQQSSISHSHPSLISRHQINQQPPSQSLSSSSLLPPLPAAMSKAINQIPETTTTTSVSTSDILEKKRSGTDLEMFSEENNNNPDKENKGRDNTNDFYLDGLSIFVGDGFDKELTNSLRKLVRDNGGNYMNEFSDIVTHFLVAGKYPTQRDAELVEGLVEVCLVSYHWLQKCVQNQALVDVSPYIVPLRLKQPVAVKERVPQNVFKQKEVVSVAPVVDAITLKKSRYSDGDIFGGYTFTVAGFSKEENAIIAKFIGDLGGKVVLLTVLEELMKSRDFDEDEVFNVRPFKTSSSSLASTSRVAGRVVTEFFVEKCIQDKTLYAPTKLCLFQPSDKTFPIPGFEEVVVGVTGLPDEDKHWAERIIAVLGGSLTHSFARNNTHLLYNSCGGDMTGPKMRKAREWGIPIVEIEWVYSCVEKGMLLPPPSVATAREKEFSMRTTKAAKLLQKSTLKTAKLFSEKVFKGVASAVAKVEQSAVKEDRETPPRKMAKQMAEEQVVIVETERATQGNEYESLLKSTIQETIDIISSKVPAPINAKHSSEPLLPAKRGLIKESYDDDDDDVADPPKRTKVHAPNQVVYIDMDAKHAQLRLMQGLEPARPKFFMFSGIVAESRPELSQTAQTLGGKVIERDVWDGQCTHLIISKVMKTEKFLAATASCAWILKSDYILACKESGKWLDENQFVITGHEHTEAAMHWKRHFIDTGEKPFSGWKCHLSIEKARKSGFERLLTAGGALIVSAIDDMLLEDGENSSDSRYHFYDKSSSADIDELRTLYPTVKVKESSRIVEYLLSAGGTPL